MHNFEHSRTRIAFLAIAAAIVVATVVIVVASTNGGDGGERRGTSFRAGAERICAATRATVDRLSAPESLADLPRFARAAGDAVRDARTEIAELAAPAGERRAVARLLRALDVQTGLIERLERSAAQGRRETAAGLIRQGAKADRRTSAAAKALRLPGCAGLTPG